MLNNIIKKSDEERKQEKLAVIFEERKRKIHMIHASEQTVLFRLNISCSLWTTSYFGTIIA